MFLCAFEQKTNVNKTHFGTQTHTHYNTLHTHGVRVHFERENLFTSDDYNSHLNWTENEIQIEMRKANKKKH